MGKKTARPIPLTLHKSGQWIKKLKVNGKWVIKYFGKDRQKALEKWADEKDYWLAGRTPPTRQTREAFTVEHACELFVQYKEGRLEIGRIGQRHFAELKEFAKVIMATLGPESPVDGLTPSDFLKLHKTFSTRWGIEREKKAIIVTRSIFKFAFESNFIDRPVPFGPDFKGAPPDQFRLAKKKKKGQALKPHELRAVIAAAKPEAKAAILLGVNCGLLPTELLALETGHIRGDRLVDFDRQKTGSPRENILWPETVKAIKALNREGLIFPGRSRHTISDWFHQLVESLGFLREGVSFKSLRDIHKTAAETCGDSEAVNRAMGHKDNSVGDRYLMEFPEARLRRVADAVRKWFNSKSGE